MMLCPNCKDGNCENCIDRLRLLYRDDPICTCKKSGHEDAINGEARRQQVQDPFTGGIHGPGIEVTPDGDVLRDRGDPSPSS